MNQFLIRATSDGRTQAAVVEAAETVGPSTICITLRPTTSPAAGLSRATLGRAVRLAGRAPRRARSACWRLPRPYCDGREADEERMVRGDRSWPAVYAPYRPSSYWYGKEKSALKKSMLVGGCRVKRWPSYSDVHLSQTTKRYPSMLNVMNDLS